MKRHVAFTVLLAVSAAMDARGEAPGPTLVGKWQVTYDLAGASHALRVETKAGGKGSFLVVDSRSSMVEPPEPSPCRWEALERGRVRLSGAVEFPIGNVGRQQGTLVLTGAFEGTDLLRGTAAFYALGVDPRGPKAAPAKTGAFSATRVP